MSLWRYDLCCRTMESQLDDKCSEHPDYCPDKLIRYSVKTGTWRGIAPNAEYEIRYCPWCRAELSLVMPSWIEQLKLELQQTNPLKDFTLVGINQLRIIKSTVGDIQVRPGDLVPVKTNIYVHELTDETIASILLLRKLTEQIQQYLADHPDWKYNG